MPIGAYLSAFNLIESLETACQQKYGYVHESGVTLNLLAHLVTVLAGHYHIGKNQVRHYLSGHRESIVPVVHGGEFEISIGKSNPHHFLDSDAVVRQQYFFCHIPPPLLIGGGG